MAMAMAGDALVSTGHMDGAMAERLAGAVVAALQAFGSRAAAKAGALPVSFP
jgi:hypothetical protein